MIPWDPHVCIIYITHKGQIHVDSESSNQCESNSVSVDQQMMSSTAPIADGVSAMVTPDSCPLVDQMENSSTSCSQKCSLWLRRICPFSCNGSNHFRAYCSLAILAVVNLLNYMDRYTLAGSFVFFLLS